MLLKKLLCYLTTMFILFNPKVIYANYCINQPLTVTYSAFLVQNDIKKPTVKKLNFFKRLQQKIFLKIATKKLKKIFKDETASVSKRAKAAFILGFITLPGVLIISGFAFITAIFAIVTGAMALKDIANSNGKLIGKNMAWTGIILGGVFLLLAVLLVAIVLANLGGIK